MLLQRKRSRRERGRSCRPGVGPCRKDGSKPEGLDAIVQAYIKHWRAGAQRELRYYRQQPSLSSAIQVAVLAMTEDGKRHPHQYRIPRSVLEEALRRLLNTRLDDCVTFDELFDRIETAILPIRGVGELTVYDTAHRIGVFLGLEPDVVYLHAGTQKGAAALGFARSRRWISADELPAEFRALAPHEIEDCLCIFKDDLKRIGTAGSAG